jgi:hypothetical protein
MRFATLIAEIAGAYVAVFVVAWNVIGWLEGRFPKRRAVR